MHGRVVRGHQHRWVLNSVDLAAGHSEHELVRLEIGPGAWRSADRLPVRVVHLPHTRHLKERGRHDVPGHLHGLRPQVGKIGDEHVERPPEGGRDVGRGGGDGDLDGRPVHPPVLSLDAIVGRLTPDEDIEVLANHRSRHHVLGDAPGAQVDPEWFAGILAVARNVGQGLLPREWQPEDFRTAGGFSWSFRVI